MLGERLKKARLRTKLMQKEAAEQIGISNVTLSHYEKGDRNPDPDTLAKLANLYKVSVDWLLGRSADQFSQFQSEDELSILDLERVIEMIEEGNAHFGGRDLTEEDSKFLANMIRLAIERKAKQDKS
ncbi:Helix-turn-helix [Thermoactinomyces sp. DSM 45891]|nr:Helix-turn-helix [Thermoactinomyces sp. DSM 45891]